MSSAEQQGISGIAVDVDHNPYLAEGAGTVDAIVSIAVGNDVAATAAAAGTGRGDHHRLLDLDAVAVREVRRGEARHRGRHQRTRRRHVLHDRRRHREGHLRLPRQTDGQRRRAQRPGRRRRAPSTACGPTAGPRWAPGSRTSAESPCNTRERSPTRSCSPTARTSTKPPNNCGEEIGAQRGRIHLRLPRSGNRLAGRGAAFDLVGIAGHRRHRRRSRRIWPTISRR